MNTKLKKLRKKAGLTQSELAIKSGLRKATISDIERGKDFKISTLFIILESLNCELQINNR